MPRRLIYSVMVGPYRPLWARCVRSMAAYATRHGITYHLQTEPVLRVRPPNSHRSESALKLGYLPELEKLHALSLLGDFDSIALIDADVWAMPEAPSIFDAVDPHADYAAVVERDMPITPAYARKLDHYARGQYGCSEYPFFNCGVEVFNASVARYLHGQSVVEFLRRPEFADYIDGKGLLKWATEQTMVNVWLRSCGAKLQRLEAKWNSLYGAVVADESRKAAFVHFFLSGHIQGDDPETLLRSGTGRARV